MTRTTRLAAALVAGLALAPVAAAEAPHVLQTVPAHGEDLVDPGLAELRVTFDQDMAPGGYSWTGGGESFPLVTGPPRWVSPRACVLPVALRPEHVYRLGINSARHTNFRSIAGEPAVPRPLWFRTGPADAAARPPSLTAETNRAAVAELRLAVDRRYSHRDRTGVDWEERFEAHRARLESAPTAWTFAARAAELLAAAEDLHVSAEAEGTTFPAFRRVVAPNCNLDAVRARLSDVTARSRSVFQGRLAGDLGYIWIGTWQDDKADPPATALDALEDLADTRGLVVDVRGNAGGSEYLARRFAGRFVAEPVVYAGHVVCDPASPSGFSDVRQRVLEPDRSRPPYGGPVVVLMGPVNMSSAEAFLLMMRQVPQCTLVGARSYGSSGNPQLLALSNGVTVLLPIWRALRLDGSDFEGEGLAPDVAVEATAAELGRGDPVLERGVALLREHLQRE